MTKRFLFISDEGENVHFDILVGKSLEEAKDKLLEFRPNITHYTYLFQNEVDSIQYAMQYKSNERIEKKFKENTNGYSS